ncbi:MAG TPA: pirin family protein [Leptospiraceae bacterium]|jgi:redox-sensitive bicupin YhaK (pirin superfamily)|nr:pirin family protein [Leptospiraceae bacterium]HNL67857.1 pirin family protein [Leptospiraceae bacterium]HNN76576.1 pirin family protein [Leptospiraceae bacterium]
MAIREVVQARVRQLTDERSVLRVLPVHGGKGVGPFLFLDHMGPWEVSPEETSDVGPHPHIGLATVTYLFEGSILHRDSVGSVQEIHPGDVNWMNAGKGIVHSERRPPSLANRAYRIHGLQAWVGLPLSQELSEPFFHHHPRRDLPHFTIDGVEISLLAGSALGVTAPAQTFSDLFYMDLRIPRGGSWTFVQDHRECALYIVEGTLRIHGQNFVSHSLVVFEPGKEVKMDAQDGVIAVLLGGAPLDGPRHMWWNFVSSSRDRIEEAKRSWASGTFGEIEGETGSIPLP